jgi:hypothetical protein
VADERIRTLSNTGDIMTPEEKALIEYCLEQQASEFNDQETQDMQNIILKLKTL